MLSVDQMEVVGFWKPDFGYVCRACAVQGLGEATVARMEVGLDREPLGWDVVLKHEATDRARDAGYCDASDPSCSQDADGFCVGCAVVTTWCNHGEIMAQIGPDGFPL